MPSSKTWMHGTLAFCLHFTFNLIAYDARYRERESRQHLMSLREGQSIGHLRSMEQEMAVQVSKLQKEQSRLHDLEEQIRHLHQLDAEQKQRREELRQRISAVTTEIRSLGSE